MTTLTVYEHERLRLGDTGLTADELAALQRFHATFRPPAQPPFTLVHRGVHFGSTVGVIRVGQRTIEVLPKADRSDRTDAQHWRGVLVGMLRAVGDLPVAAPTEAALDLRHDDLLQLYFELFVRECETLLRRGLVRQYRRVQDDQLALRGRLVMATHLRKNHLHRERFLTEHTVYDRQHLAHQLLAETLELIGRSHRSPALAGRLARLRLDFPQQATLGRVTPEHFARLGLPHGTLPRKLAPYRRALDIARLLLLNLHPGLRAGRHELLALLFDMNTLWERFVGVALRRHLLGFSVDLQQVSRFWAGGPHTRTLRPDIVLTRVDSGQRTVLDTKWKALADPHPSIGDLRQLYAYAHYFDAAHAGLIYPGDWGHVSGAFEATARHEARETHVFGLSPKPEIGVWMQELAAAVAAAAVK